ncbi:MAG TPA: SagB/ThcOx family dehydrogenase [Clostridia bacterium]|nr:SagB/ThcOx family dehydrogenase [Clostridia bacterium]
MYQAKRYLEENWLDLPKPATKGEISLEESLAKRSSVRKFKEQLLSLEEVAQLLWAAYGLTEVGRTAPSAGGIYPLSLYLIARKVKDLEPGVYRYWPEGHRLSEIEIGDIGKELREVTFGQSFVSQAPICLVVAADFGKATDKYGKKGDSYVYIEVGHLGENVYLQAQSLGLGTVAVGAFDEKLARNLFNISENEEVLYLMPVGWPS